MDDSLIHPSLLTDLSDLLLNEALDVLFPRQFELVLGNEEVVVHSRQRVLDKRMVLVRAEQETDGRVVTLDHHVVSIPVHVGVELAEVFVGECGDFQLHQHVALEDAMIQHQVHKPVCVADEDAFLPCFNTESVTQFKEEVLELVEQGILQV